MFLVSMSSPENSRPLGLLFSNNPNYGYPQFPWVPLKIAVMLCYVLWGKQSFTMRKMHFPHSKRHLLWGKCIFLIVKFSKEIFLIFQWFIQRIKNLNFKKFFSHTKWVKTLVKIFKNGIFQKLLRIFWFIQKIENLKINFFPINFQK